jgi:hypothetical protein
MKRIYVLALFGLVAAAVAGCSDTYYDRDAGYGYHRDYDHDRYRRDYDRDGAYDRDRDRGYWRDGRRYCRDDDGDEYAC